MLSKKYFIVLLVIIYAAAVHAQQVIKINTDSGDLPKQFTSCFNSAQKGSSFWIAYSIQRTDERKILVGSCFCCDDNSAITLRDIIENTKKFSDYRSGNTHRKRSRISGTMLNISSRSKNSDKVTDKETAVLFRYDKYSKNINDFAEIAICNLSYYFDTDGYPILWLGKKESKASLDFLFDLYKKAKDKSEKKDLMQATGIHNDQPVVTTFLKNIINSKEDLELRKNTVFWLGIQDNNDAFAELKNIINKNASFELRKDAVFGLSSIEVPGALDELINIARHNENSEIRKNAVYGLGNKAVQKAEEALKNIIENDPDIEIKKAAVYSLANNPEKNIPYLIKVAKTNPSLEIRKSAIWSLGNASDDKRAVDALIDLARN